MRGWREDNQFGFIALHHRSPDALGQSLATEVSFDARSSQRCTLEVSRHLNKG